MAGLMHLKTALVLLAALTSAFAWNVLLLYGGYLLGSNWQDIGSYAAMYSIPVTIAFVLMVFFVVWKFLKERKQGHE